MFSSVEAVYTVELGVRGARALMQCMSGHDSLDELVIGKYKLTENEAVEWSKLPKARDAEDAVLGGELDSMRTADVLKVHQTHGA